LSLKKGVHKRWMKAQLDQHGTKKVERRALRRKKGRSFGEGRERGVPNKGKKTSSVPRSGGGQVIDEGAQNRSSQRFSPSKETKKFPKKKKGGTDEKGRGKGNNEGVLSRSGKTEKIYKTLGAGLRKSQVQRNGTGREKKTNQKGNRACERKKGKLGEEGQRRDLGD